MGPLPWLLVTVVIVIHAGGTGGGIGRVTAERVDHVVRFEESEERVEHVRVTRSSSSSSSFGPKHLSTKKQCSDNGFRDTFTAAVADALGLSETERASIVLREHQTEALNGLAKSFELRSGGQSAGRVVDADEALRHVLLRCVDEPPSVVCRDASDSTTPKPKQSKAKKDKDSSSSSSPACPEGEESSGGGSFDRVEELAVAVIAAISLAGNLWSGAKAFCAKHCAGGAYQSVATGAAASSTEREVVANGSGKALTPTERAALAREEANNNNVGNSGSSYYSSHVVGQSGQYPGGTGALPSSSSQHQQSQQQFQPPQAVFVVAEQQPQHQPAVALNASGASSSSSVAAAAALNQSLRRQRQTGDATAASFQPLVVIAPQPQPAARLLLNSTSFLSPSAPSPSLSSIISPNPTNPANLYPTIHSNPTNPYYPNSTNPSSNPFVDGASGGGDYTTDSGFGQY